jgi:hypothetical protein
MHLYLTLIDQSGENGVVAGRPVDLDMSDKAVEGPVSPKAARDAAERLIRDADATLTWFRRRERQPLWRRGRRLQPGEKRLDQFLSETVLPSAKLLLAGIMLAQREPMEAERLAEPIRVAVLNAELSYRAAYNLACYEVAAAFPAESGGLEHPEREAGAQPDRVDVHLKSALTALREALSAVHGRRRSELGRWAYVDPAIKALRQCSRIAPSTQSQKTSTEPPTYEARFKDRLKLYGIVKPAETQANDTALSAEPRPSQAATSAGPAAS